MIVIGKFGGAPFASKATAEDFLSKYSVSGTLIAYKYGFGVVVERSSCPLSNEQIESRSLATINNGEINELNLEGSYQQRRISSQNRIRSDKNDAVNHISAIDQIKIYGIKAVVDECYKRKNELDESTAGWLRRVRYVIEKNGEDAIHNQTLGRLHGILKRLDIHI